MLGLLAASVTMAHAPAQAQAPIPPDLRAHAAQQVQPLLDTLKQLVAIESGSRDLEGLGQIAEVIATRLRGAGMTTQVLPAQAPAFNPQLKGARLGSMVYGTKTGSGQRKVLLIAHMDTVYPRGMGAKQPFRIDGDRAYGLGIADDKGGVALVLHTVELLRDLGLQDFAQLGVLINADEEIGSAGSASLIAQLGSEYDAVFSFEGGGVDQDHLRLATGTAAAVDMRVKGRASHAGAAPEAGRNALYELAHQILKTSRFGEPERGLKINWTIASAGDTRNVIPASATAMADVRASSDQDLDRLDARLREAIQDKLIPDTTIELDFRRGRPLFQATDAGRAIARHAKAVFAEIGLPLLVRERAFGGVTDAAFAAMRPKGGVVESFGLRGFGAHSSDNEYIFISSIAPRLYLAARMVIDVGRGAVAW